MSDDLFELVPPRPLRIPEVIVDRAVKRLAKLVESMPDGPDAGGSDYIEELRNRLKKAARTGQSFEEATQVPHRERRLCWLYTLDLGVPESQKWLPPFDSNVASSVLGSDPDEWHPARRRAVTQLFFTQYDRIVAVAVVANMLRKAWAHATDGAFDDVALKWAAESKLLFWENGAQRLARKWMAGESVDDLSDRYFIHKDSRFRESLLHAVLLERLKRLPFGASDDGLFDQIQRDKSANVGEGRLLGSVAVEHLVRSAIEQSVGSWKDRWSKALVLLSCDPRLPQAAERQRWWGWATPRERDVAVRALSGLTITEFIKLLERSLRGTDAERQFERRRDFLLELFKREKIIEARLLVHRDLFEQLDRATRTNLMLGKVGGGSTSTSMICLRCVNDVYLIEGTHSFGLRGFDGEKRFPIRDFWNSSPREYADSQLRVSEYDCDIFQRHHVGDWVGGFFEQLAIQCRVRWARF